MAIAHEASSAVRLEPAASEAAERLFQQHAGWIYGYCLRQLRSPEEAEDALQATYLNACRSLKDGFEPRAASAWLLKVAQNVCISRLRASGRRARLERSQPNEVLAETLPAAERATDELIGLPEALATLPAAQRRAILLREWQGLSYREVGEELGLTPAAVETLIFRARRSLVAALERPDARRPRALHGWNLAGAGAALKSLLAGGAGAKVAAVVAAAATATVVAADPVGWHGSSSAGAVVEKAAPPAPPLPERPARPELALEGREHRIAAIA
ncbi:MAG TPA: RNA polymerase sigma factor, partial [Gaiellaceae bacterium]|nr:RNA polymerase sigma factor [Gaiellaceae bacterium]